MAPGFEPTAFQTRVRDHNLLLSTDLCIIPLHGGTRRASSADRNSTRRKGSSVAIGDGFDFYGGVKVTYVGWRTKERRRVPFLLFDWFGSNEFLLRVIMSPSSIVVSDADCGAIGYGFESWNRFKIFFTFSLLSGAGIPLLSGRGNLVVKVTDSWQACHEFELVPLKNHSSEGTDARQIRRV
ncbi:hypothetical protein TNCV_2305001 [Trichonephila clavipes]|nr:hypothetical protein TNCV_2305001 [Trichonephila clavipes]